MNKIKEFKDGVKYSKAEFDDYTYRFIVVFKVDNDWRNDTRMDIYSNSDSYQILTDFINEVKTKKVIEFEIVHRASKEQDKRTSEFINAYLKEGL